MAPARLSFSLQKCVDHLDRVLAGCCWLKRWLPFFGLSWRMIPKSSIMRERCIYAPTTVPHSTGYNPSIRSCCTHRPDTVRPGQEKGIDPAVAWPVSPHTLDRPRNGDHLLLAPDFVTGLVFAMRIPCRCGFRPHWAPVILQQLQRKEDSYRAAHPSWIGSG